MRVLIAGGGVAALETALALRALAAERVQIELLAPDREFAYRPLAVAAPFRRGEVQRFGLRGFADECGAVLRHGRLAAVDVERRVARTASADLLVYDKLVVATGARMRAVLPSALTFTGETDELAFRYLLDACVERGRAKLVFAAPGGPAWLLPLYELALMSAAYLKERRVEPMSLIVVTPEPRPLAVFGRSASDGVAQLLREQGIEFLGGHHVSGSDDEGLDLVPTARLAADMVVTVPRLEGLRVHGLPSDRAGFLPTDPHGQVLESSCVFAAGDVTTFPLKHGGIAAQQADAVAETIAALAGAPVRPSPFRPVLRGLLLTGSSARYLRNELATGIGGPSEISTDMLWWPAAKIVGKHLAPYLAARSGLELQPLAAKVGLEVALPLH